MRICGINFLMMKKMMTKILDEICPMCEEGQLEEGTYLFRGVTFVIGVCPLCKSESVSLEQYAKNFEEWVKSGL